MISQCLNDDCWYRLASYLAQFQFKIIIYKEISHGVNQICSGHNFLVIPVSPWFPDGGIQSCNIQPPYPLHSSHDVRILIRDYHIRPDSAWTSHQPYCYILTKNVWTTSGRGPKFSQNLFGPAPGSATYNRGSWHRKLSIAVWHSVTFFVKLGSKSLTSSYSQLWFIFSCQKNVE